MSLLRIASIAIAGIGLLKSPRHVAAESVKLRIEGADGRPMPCRVHLKDPAGKPVRPPKLPFFRDHFICPGTVTLTLKPGRYAFEIERGPEFRRISGSVAVEAGKAKTIKLQLKRLANLAKLGWHSGDLHVHRAVEDAKLLMQAEDLHVAPFITWWNESNLWKTRPMPKKTLTHFDGNRYYDVMAGEDEREGGALLYFGLKRPLAITGSSREYPSPMKFVAAARKHKNVWIDIEKPFWWDVPIWLAAGQVDSIGIANNHMCRSRMLASEAWGRPRDNKRLPSPRGNGFWTQEIYYHILNTGIQLPPSAGSASGVLPNPVGYNRVYVHTTGEFNDEKWWAGLKQGRSFVTNGPLLLVTANGQLPGHVFRKKIGSLKLSLDCRLWSNDPMESIEIIQNGAVARRIEIKADRKFAGDRIDLGTITFRRSGWFLVRAITREKRTFRFASTAPYYVRIGKEEARISRKSVKFFQAWVDERMKRVGRKLKDAEKLREVLRHHKDAARFWSEKMKAANAD